MAKDGTNRGGLRIGAGNKPKNYKPIDFDTLQDSISELPEAEELDVGYEIPEVSEYLKELQRDGSKLCAEKIFNDTYIWLARQGCEDIVSQQLIEQYSMSVARWIQCEKEISRHGLLSAHPTTKVPIASPFVSMSREYKKQVNADFYQIYVIVREHSLGIEDEHDEMEDLLD